MNEHDFIVEQVRTAGALLLRLRDEKFDTLAKGGDPRNVVTSVDLAVNDFLVAAIKQAFPGDAIYSEETGGDVSGVDRLWTIDPIDGSWNFSRSIPHFAICLALLKKGVPQAGVVYNPVTDELFSFNKGAGAFLNGKPMYVSSVTDLKDATILLQTGSKPERWDWGTKAYRALLEHANKTRNLSGSALDICFIAAGRVEAAVYGTLSTLDIAAAVGILHEAGGIVVNEKGEPSPLLPTSERIVAANNGTIVGALRSVL